GLGTAVAVVVMVIPSLGEELLGLASPHAEASGVLDEVVCGAFGEVGSQPVDPVGVLGDEAAGGAFGAAQPLALELGQSSLDSVRVDAELGGEPANARDLGSRDRKSTRLNSSHVSISYAVFCLKKKKQQT